MTLTEFLLARIADDEAVARDWPDGDQWGRYDDETMWVDSYGRPIYAPRRRVLADAAAKRAVVESVCSARRVRRATDVPGRYDVVTEWEPIYEANGDIVTALLALPYEDHPDYDESWRP